MMNKWLRCIVVIGLTGFNAAFASAFRCGSELVRVGDYKPEVYEKCGKPESIETHREFVSQASDARIRSRDVSSGLKRQFTQEIKVEQWIYNFGPNRFRQYLRFENGRLTHVETLGRGD